MLQNVFGSRLSSIVGTVDALLLSVPCSVLHAFLHIVEYILAAEEGVVIW